MARALKIILSDWSIILIVSVLLFVFWGGPVFTADSLAHGGRLITSYAIIPAGVAIALLFRRQWSWSAFGYYTFGIALIKMVITMTIFLWVIPSGQRVQSRPIDISERGAQQQVGYETVHVTEWGRITGIVPPSSDEAEVGTVAAILDIASGKAPHPQTLVAAIADSIISQEFLVATVGDTLLIRNTDSAFHTFSLNNAEGQLFQLPLPASREASRLLRQAGAYRSRCVRNHAAETLTLLVFEHPYHARAVSGREFAVDSVLPGSYRLGMWRIDDRVAYDLDQPDQVAEFEVAAGEETEIEWPSDSDGANMNP